MTESKETAVSDAALAGRYVVANGINIYYEEEGQASRFFYSMEASAPITIGSRNCLPGLPTFESSCLTIEGTGEQSILEAR